MPAIPVKERWWKSRAESDPRGDWYCLTTDIFPFQSGWDRLRDRSGNTDPEIANVGELAPYEYCILDQLDGCLSCRRWDMSKVNEPIDMLLQPTNKKTKILSPHFYKNAWITNIRGIQMSIIHRRLLNVIGEYLDDDVLLGDVFVSGGDQIHDVVSVVDTASQPCRKKLRKSWFDAPASRDNFPCLECGRFRYACEDWPEYVYTPEHASRAPRFYTGSLLLSPEIIAKTNLLEKKSWPKLKCRKVKEFSVQLDPLPSPIPRYWEELESFFQSKGVEFPFYKAHKVDAHMSWLEERIKRLGVESCIVDVSNIKGTVSAELLATMVFNLRFRAIVEPKIAKRIDHWDDQQLMQFLSEYREASGSLGNYFPV